MDVSVLAAGGVAMFVGTGLGGIAGFGCSLVATPLLLLVGLPLSEVVVVNLAVVVLTRAVVVWRCRESVQLRKAGQLVAGGLPGIGGGMVVVGFADTKALKIVAGALALGAALFLALHPGKSGPRRDRSGNVVAAGFAGGFLGPTTSLNGIAPAVILTHDDTGARAFIANLAAYFMVSNIVTLIALVTTEYVSFYQIGRYLAVWLPIGIIGNLLGIHYSSRLPHKMFRRVTLAVIGVSGCTTVISVFF
jgi:uncharacterized membrane protein YfcA